MPKNYRDMPNVIHDANPGLGVEAIRKVQLLVNQALNLKGGEALKEDGAWTVKNDPEKHIRNSKTGARLQEFLQMQGFNPGHKKWDNEDFTNGLRQLASLAPGPAVLNAGELKKLDAHLDRQLGLAAPAPQNRAADAGSTVAARARAQHEEHERAVRENIRAMSAELRTSVQHTEAGNYLFYVPRGQSPETFRAQTAAKFGVERRDKPGPNGELPVGLLHQSSANVSYFIVQGNVVDQYFAEQKGKLDNVFADTAPKPNMHVAAIPAP